VGGGLERHRVLEQHAAAGPEPGADHDRRRRGQAEGVRAGDDHGIGFFVVADGEAVASVDGKEVARLGPGSHFGEVALISDRVRTASVTAATDLHCYVMTLWDFRSFVKGDADVAWKLLEQLAHMLHGARSATH